MTMGSLERKLARKAERKAERKNGINGGHGMNPLAALQALQGVQEAAKAAGQITEAAEQVQRFVGELEDAREGLMEATETIRGLQYELEKQRAVFLRFLYSPDFIVTRGPEGVDRILQAEAQFRAEYDAMQALKLLVSVQEGS